MNGIERILTGSPPTDPLPGEVRVDILAFWRLYDPSAKKIVDQYQWKSYLNYYRHSGQYTLPSAAALRSTAHEAGREYIERFLPGYYTVKRDMYKKGKGASKEKFEAAFRRTEVANWEDAIADWTEIANHADHETAGRACLNIAVSYEVLGDTEKALQWAKKSYEEYGDKLGKEYVGVLLQRRSVE